jgi:hypothetical protein
MARSRRACSIQSALRSGIPHENMETQVHLNAGLRMPNQGRHHILHVLPHKRQEPAGEYFAVTQREQAQP